MFDKVGFIDLKKKCGIKIVELILVIVYIVYVND